MIKDPAESERCKNPNIRGPRLRRVEGTRFYRVERQKRGWKQRDGLKCVRRY